MFRINNRRKKIDAKTDIDGPKFDPQDSMTYVHNWEMNNDYNFRQLALYGDKSKLEEKPIL